ncbi:MAG TPA: hypothetical protein DCS60_05430 [Opitutae bacterium]|nr:hypothetical protein [Opitutae bacterium]
MDQETTGLAGRGLWGLIWVAYAYFYGRYFGHVARRLKPGLCDAGLPGSRERLAAKQFWCYWFSAFMLIPTVLELIRSSPFTSGVISILPCLFGVWVMQAVWCEVLHSKVPNSEYANRQRR